MPGAVTISHQMAGSVQHHGNHIIGTNPDGSPEYCKGHSVKGVQTTGASKTFVERRNSARVGDTGTTDCECDQGPYNITSGSSKVFIERISAARIGDSTNIHGAGTGRMITGSSKVFIGG